MQQLASRLRGTAANPDIYCDEHYNQDEKHNAKPLHNLLRPLAA
jgi:hypothetical protein